MIDCYRVEPSLLSGEEGTTGIGASRPLPSGPTKVRLLNRLPTLDLGGGDYSSCPEAVVAARTRFGSDGWERDIPDLPGR